jgi:hypothetical protein
VIGLTSVKVSPRSYRAYQRLTIKNLPGLGKALDLIKSEYVLEVKGKKFF